MPKDRTLHYWWETVTEVFSGAERTWRRLNQPPPRPKAEVLGLALGSGGLRGGAHVGVLQVMAENGVEPLMLAGSSAGSVVAVLKAAGFDADNLQKLAKQLTPELFTDLSVPKFQLLTVGARALRDYLGTRKNSNRRQTSGLIRGERFSTWLRGIIGQRHFEELLIPTYVVAADIAHGEAVVFGPEHPKPPLPKGYAYLTGVDVVTAVRASSAIPLVFEPVGLGRRILVDGAFAEPVPVSILRSAGANRIVAVDLAAFSESATETNTETLYNLFDVLGRATALLTDRYSALRLTEFADVLIRPGQKGSYLTDTDAVQYHIEAGRSAAEQVLPMLRAAG